MNATEAAPHAAPPGPADTATLDALKRIKLTETEWDEKVATARREAEASLKRLKEETETRLAAARAEAEAERGRTLEKARAEADTEATAIVAEGERAAQKATEGTGKGVTARKDEILAVVLGGFQSE